MQWILLAPATVVQTVKLSNQPSLIVYKDQEVAPLIPVYVTKIMESPAPADRIISSIPNGTKFRFLVMVKDICPSTFLTMVPISGSGITLGERPLRERVDTVWC